MARKIIAKLSLFCADQPKTLKEFYNEFDNYEPHTIRARLNENIGNAFKRVSRGVYLAEKNGAQALIIEGDAWNEIKNINDSSIDTIITDSPYSCLNKHLATGTTRKKTGSWSFQTKDIDQALLIEMLRVLKPGGHFFSFAPSDAKDTLDFNNNFLATARKVGFEFNKRFIWNKILMGMGFSGRNSYEQIFFLSKGERRKPYDLSIRDLLTHKALRGPSKIHETEKPVELIIDLMKFSNQRGDLVLDTFAGSMSVAKAGLALGINTICIEIDKLMVQKSIQHIQNI
jgi:DNA modification methylase